MKKIFFSLTFILLCAPFFCQGAPSASTEPGILDIIYEGFETEELYCTDYSLGENEILIMLNKTDKPITRTYYDKDCYYSLLIVKGNERAFTVYNLICVTDAWLNEIIFNIVSMKYPTDFKIENIQYLDNPESIKFHVLDDTAFKIVTYLYDLK